MARAEGARPSRPDSTAAARGTAAARWGVVRTAALRDLPDSVHVSALTGEGLGALLERLDALLEHDPLSRVRLRIPQKEGKALALIEAGGRVLARHYRGGLVELEAEAPASVVRKLKAFVIE